MPKNESLPESIRVVRSEQEPWERSVRRATGEELGEAVFVSELAGMSRLRIHRERLEPGRRSAARHRHSDREEAFFVLRGEVTLVVDEQESRLGPGDFAAVGPSESSYHTLINRSSQPAEFLAMSDEGGSDEVTFHPDELADGRSG